MRGVAAVIQNDTRFSAGLAAGALLLFITGCQQPEVRRKEAVAHYQQMVAGEWVSQGGALLLIAPVRSRMVTDESVYLERTDSRGTFARLIAVDYNDDKHEVVLHALTFTQEGQWRNLRETPELFTALLPKDVKPAGTCDIKPAEDGNSLSYSCVGSPPETFRRK